MKKVMIGILVLIPIIIVLIVAMVSQFVSMNAWIAVDDIEVTYKDTEIEAEQLSFSLDNVSNKVLNMYDYLDIEVFPKKASHYSIEWRVAGNLVYTDLDEEKKYNQYKQEFSAMIGTLETEFAQNGTFIDEDHLSAYNSVKADYGYDTNKMIEAMAKQLVKEVKPAIAFIDADGNVVDTNTSGDFIIASYCKGTIEIIVENVTKTLLISVDGEDVKSVTITSRQGEESNKLKVGESKRIVANYTPLSCIVDYVIWEAKNPEIATIDQNGVITAKSVGNAQFAMKASVYSSVQAGGEIQYVESNVYTIEVEANDGLSAKYGATVYANNKRTYHLLNDLGISAEDITVDGGSISEGVLTITDSDVVTLRANGKTFVLNVCDDGDIAIEHTSFYNTDSGYVLGVDERPLKLNATWKSAFKEGVPTVTWKSSREDIATVDNNGNVYGKSAGEVEITAECGDYRVSVTINVQNKISLLQLRTSNEALAVGLARESVFATFNFVNENPLTDSDAVEDNYVDIKVLGEPKRTDFENEDDYKSALAYFYDSYTLEIVRGGGIFARFDSLVKNRIWFDSAALEGKGKQAIVVRVSAKYPKYEGMSNFTTEEVTINVVYGVSVYNVMQLERASNMQRDYVQFDWFNWQTDAFEDFNAKYYQEAGKIIQPAHRAFEHYVVNGDQTDRYTVDYEPTSSRTYAIVLMADCNYGDYADTAKYQSLASANDRANFFGNVYGNNNMISALQGQMAKNVKLIRISWSGVTVSNTILRANNLGDNAEITSDETSTFVSSISEIGSHHDWNRYHLTDVKFEYCIMENGREVAHMPNSDVTIDGCVIRNFISVGFYAPNKINYFADGKESRYNVMYSHININNVTCSNMFASLVSASYENFSIDEDGNNRFVKNGTTAENDAYFMEHFYPYGINFELTQTGFFNAYNWQKVDNVSIIKTDDETVNNLIQTGSSELIATNRSFDDFLYVDDKGDKWFHMIFLVSGIQLGGGLNIRSESTFAKMTLANEEIKHIHVGSIDDSTAGIATIVKNMLSTAYFYGYNNSASITPYSGYVINADYISRLH